MSDSREDVASIKLSEFINSTLENQKRFIRQVKITQLKRPKDQTLLKKLIAMKVLVECKKAAEEKSFLDLTAHFRYLCSFIPLLTDFRIKNETVGEPSKIYDSLLDMTGYNIYLDNKLFLLKVDDQSNILSKTLELSYSGFDSDYVYERSETACKWNILDKEELSKLLLHIRQETIYKNSLAYDFLTLLIRSSYGNIDGVLRALLISLVLLPITLPMTLVCMGIEYLCITPLKWLVNLIQTNGDEEFINQVFSAENPSTYEIRKNARILAQGHRSHIFFSRMDKYVLQDIAAFTGDPECHKAEGADKIAEKYFCKP